MTLRGPKMTDRIGCTCETDKTLCEVQRCLRKVLAIQASVQDSVPLRAELKSRLLSAKTAIDRTIERHNTTVEAAAENFHEIQCRYQTIVDEYEDLEASVERRAVKAYDMCCVYEKECGRQRTLDAENFRLQTENQRLREYLDDRCRDTDRLKAQQEMLAKCRKRTTADLDRATAASAKCRVELDANRREVCELTVRVKDAETTANRGTKKRQLLELKLTEIGYSLVHRKNVGSRRECVANAMLTWQKAWHGQLMGSLDAANRKVEVLRMKKRSTDSGCGIIGRLRENVTRAEDELAELRRRNDKRTAELEQLWRRKVQLAGRVNELRCELEDVKSATAEAMVARRKTYEDHLDEVARARNDLASKCRRIAELNDLQERAEREKREREAAAEVTKQTSSCGRQRRSYAGVDRSSYHPVYVFDEVLMELISENLW